MGVFGRIKNAVSNFYGGEEDFDEEFEDEERDDELDFQDFEDDDFEGEGEDSLQEDFLGGESEDSVARGEEEGAEDNAQELEEDEMEIKRQERENPFTKAGRAIMIKEATTHGCMPRPEKIPCPICHATSIFKSYRPFDWFPLQVTAYAFGVPLNRFYCFNKKCSKSWYRGYVFNCPNSVFQPASVPTKRQFNAS